MALLALNAPALAADDAQSLQELRNTVINLLNSLVQKGVLTAEQARAMVADAQAKAAADAKAQADQEVAERNAVRVPYVPQIVKDEISKQVASEVKPEVVADVVQQAKSERWGIPAALPDWLARVRMFGDLRLRAEEYHFPEGNVPNYWLNFNAINSAGGFSKAGQSAFLNVNDDFQWLRVRARLGLAAELSPELSAGIRVATGSSTDPVSESQTLGTYGARYNVGFDELFLRWDQRDAQQFSWFSATGGRIPSPWFAPTDLIFHKDLTFEGLATSARLGWGDGGAQPSQVYLTAGAFPIQQVVAFPIALSDSGNKWMFGGQLGAELRWDHEQRLRFALAYYDFADITGVRNAPGLTLTNYTAPAFIRFGNSLYDISNSTDPTVNLYALAAKFRLANLSLGYELPLGRHALIATAEAVRNLGYNEADVLARTGQTIPAEVNGTQEELSFGTPTFTSRGLWRVLAGYRYLQRDAVLDAWTNSDFHGGGTNARGYYLLGDLGIAHGSWLQLLYMSSDVINGPRFSIDQIELDLNAQF